MGRIERNTLPPALDVGAKPAPKADVAVIETDNTALQAAVMKQEKLSNTKELFEAHGIRASESANQAAESRRESQEQKRIQDALARIKNDVYSGGSMTSAIGKLVAAGFSVEKLTLNIINAAVSEHEKKPETVKAATADRLGDLKNLTETDIAAVIGRGGDLTLENIYKAKHQGMPATEKPAVDWAVIEPEVEKVLESPEDKGFAKFLFENGLPVTAENIRKAEFLGNIANEIDPEQILEMINERLGGGELLLFDAKTRVTPMKLLARLEEMRNALKNVAQTQEGGADGDLRLLTARRQIEEIRHRLTHEAAAKLAARGVELDTMSIGKALDELKSLEFEAYGQNLRLMGVDDTPENRAVIGETMEAARELPQLPLLTYGELFRREIPETLEGINTSAQAAPYKARAVLRDLGLQETAPNPKAGEGFAVVRGQLSVLLEGLDIPATDEFLRAAAILSRNHIDVNLENVMEIHGLDTKLTQVAKSLHPNIVASMLAEGLNPSEMEIDDILEYIGGFKEQYGEDVREKVARYIDELDRTTELTPERRAELIGVYRMLHTVARHENVALGVSLKHGMEMNLKQLMDATANFHRSDKERVFVNNIESPRGTSRAIWRFNKQNIDSFADMATPPELNRLMDAKEDYKTAALREVLSELEAFGLHNLSVEDSDVWQGKVANAAANAGGDVLMFMRKFGVPFTLENLNLSSRSVREPNYASDLLNEVHAAGIPLHMLDTEKLEHMDESGKTDAQAVWSSLYERIQDADAGDSEYERVNAWARAVKFLGAHGGGLPVFVKNKPATLNMYVINEKEDSEDVNAVMLLHIGGREVRREFSCRADEVKAHAQAILEGLTDED